MKAIQPLQSHKYYIYLRRKCFTLIQYSFYRLDFMMQTDVVSKAHFHGISAANRKFCKLICQSLQAIAKYH